MSLRVSAHLKDSLLDIVYRATVCGKPSLQLGLMHRCDGAFGDCPQLGIDFEHGRVGDADCRVEQIAVEVHPARIDGGVQHPFGLEFRAQGADALIQLPFDANVLLAIFVQPLAAIEVVEPVDFIRVFVLARTSRPGHLQHEAMAGRVLPLLQVQCCSDCLQLGGER